MRWRRFYNDTTAFWQCLFSAVGAIAKELRELYHVTRG